MIWVLGASKPNEVPSLLIVNCQLSIVVGVGDVVVIIVVVVIVLF
jgi:hypothetical protein